VRSRSPVASYLARRRAYWPWWLLYTFSPYHRGYDQGYEQAVKNLRACGALKVDTRDIETDTTVRR